MCAGSGAKFDTPPAAALNSVVRTFPSARSVFEPCENVADRAVVRVVGIGKDHGAIQRDGIGGAIRMGAISLPGALPVAEMDVTCLVDRGPLARIRKLAR